MSFELILPFFPEELRVLLLDPSISDLMINGTTGVYADRGGVVEHIALSTPYSNDRLQAAIERVARLLGQDLTSQNPILNTRLPDGSRVAVVGSPSSINGPTFTVRKFNRWFTSDDLIKSGSLPEQIRDAVVSFIAERKNGIISGGTGSGKTTLMKALLDHVPLHERLIVIEQPAELKITHPNAVRWEAVEAIPGQVAVTPSQLVAAALRHRPDRIIMGEIRDECGYDLLQAMNTGHGGTLSTIHAKSAWDDVITDRVNACIKPNDVLYFLGDFCLGRAEQVTAYRKRLACRTIHFMEGNHDKVTRRLQNLFASWNSLSEINVSKERIVLCHYAMRVWLHHAQGAWQLYGHSHGNLLDEPLALSLDVGVDTHDFRPWHFEEIQNVMKAKAEARESNARIERRAVLAELAAYDQEIGI